MLDALIGTEPLFVCMQSNLVDPDAFVSFKFCLGDRIIGTSEKIKQSQFFSNLP